MVRIDNILLPGFPLLLAPMEDVSDPPFRAICRELGADLLYTEFISSEGLIRNSTACKRKLDIFDEERPVGVQIFGGDEDSLAMASEIVDIVRPDLLDINFGCPVKQVAARGAGAGVLKDIDLMVRLSSACVRSTRLPVTVKTRLGWDDDSKNIMDVALRLQDVGIKALTSHGRTRCQMYKGMADWHLIGEVKNNPGIHIPVFGNGDINSPQKALDYKNKYGVDGIMIGRAAIGHPWIFREIKHFIKTGGLANPPTVQERISVCKDHLARSIAWKGKEKGMYAMRGKYAGYLKGLPGITAFTKRLMLLTTFVEISAVLEEALHFYKGYEAVQLPIELINYHAKCAV
ncbi:MAG: tRNA dihydrouridine synthase DusB [Bacteroidota bacterium]|nr:tRNA dihydrouridine synthase DusB [Bacteroidota bacterium]